MKWQKFCNLEDVPRLGARTLCLPVGRVAVFRTRDDRVFALLDECPHKQGPLSQGIVYGTRVTCPLHEMVIELDSGSAVAPDEGQTPTFATRVVDGGIEICLSETGATAK
ncbi:MAG: nitrite reductase small subunit NirD [Rhodospirillales bacterium]|nr:nitrite reductase small subunit NirD [Rhodospirillales bacterium]